MEDVSKNAWDRKTQKRFAALKLELTCPQRDGWRVLVAVKQEIRGVLMKESLSYKPTAHLGWLIDA